MIATKIGAPRGRPRSFDAEAAVDTALTLFRRRGYDAVSVAELGAALGINPPSFYAAFGSKAALFGRALERYEASEANIFARALAGGGGVLAVIERTLRDAARRYPERDGLAGCLVLDGTRHCTDPEVAAAVTARKDAGRAAIRTFIATEFPAKAETLAGLVSIAMAGMSAAARDGARETALTQFAAAMARAFRREAEGG